MNSRQMVVWVALVTLILGVVFRFFPEIDIAATRLFFVEGQGFPWRANVFLDVVHESVYVFTPLISALWLGLLAFYYATKRQYFGLSPIKLYYLIAVLLIGPGLLVNVVSKDNLWGRARPIQTTLFGGTQEFSPAFTISDQCQENCSFVSGHASMGFYGFAIALVSVGVWRRRIFLVTLGTGGLVSAARVMEGSHFLSDVLFCGLLMYFVSVGMWWVFEKIEKQ